MRFESFMKCAAVAVLACLLAACKDQAAPAPENARQAEETGTREFQVKGEVVEVKPGGTVAVIKHEEIPGYMMAMTMPFEAKNTNELAGVSAGDKVSFRMLVTEDDAWIDRVIVVEKGTNAPSRTPSVRRVRMVEPLELGDKIPNYTFTNELGKAVSFQELEGQAVAFTFIFTRCPMPNFCPRMSKNFEEAYTKLKALPDAPKTWRLFSITIDPDFDTPAILKAYAQQYQRDPDRWNFLTGAMIDIDALTEQFGLWFNREPGTFDINHNLRTVVLDTKGRVQHVFVGNEWKSEELVEQLVKAAAPESKPSQP